MSISDISNAIVDGLTNFIGKIGAGILDFIVSVLATIINIILTPIDAIISFVIPDLTNIINNFYNIIDLFFTDLITYIYSYIPPMTKSVMLLFITIYISYYSMKYIYKGIILVPKIIQKIKIW